MLIPCAECKKEISHTAGNCPNCGSKKPFKGVQLDAKAIKDWKVADRMGFQKSGGKLKASYTFLKIIGIGFFTLIIISMINHANLTPEEKAEYEKQRLIRAAEQAKKDASEALAEAEKTCSNTTLAFVMSQDFVTKQLKAPATADFPNISSEGVSVNYLGNCVHEIRAYVDAQNSFGANIRSHYYVKIKNELNTDSWSLLKIQIY